jgi:hypothetical protein
MAPLSLKAPTAEVLSVIEEERVTEQEFHAGTTQLTVMREGLETRQALNEINARADAIDKAIDALEVRCVR